jgi:hypothetical protein
VYAGALSLLTLYVLDEVEMIGSSAPRVIEFSGEQGFPFYLTIAQICQGWAFARGGSPEDGIAQMRAGIEGLRATGSIVVLPAFFVMLASGFGQNGQGRGGIRVHRVSAGASAGRKRKPIGSERLSSWPRTILIRKLPKPL